MYRLILVWLSVACMATAACAQQKQDMVNGFDTKHSRALVAYFSATGTTARAAELLAKAVDGDLYAITPADPYTGADLDWRDRQSRSSLEMNDEHSRPSIKAVKIDIEDYDTVFIGYPIWWNLAPRVINTFIESLDLEGKTVVPFATSGGSGISNSVSVLKKTYPDIKWKEGRLLNSASSEVINHWLESL